MAKAKFRSEHDEYAGMPGVVCEDFDPITGEKMPPRTKQADKEGCDIHYILRKIENGGMLPEMMRSNPRYGDFSEVKDFQQSMEVVFKAQEQFDALPAKIRDRFDHDPVKMLAFVADPRNADKLVEMGLALPKKPQEANLPAPQPPAKESGAAASPAKA